MTLSNIHLSEAANTLWDVLVIGGGPAGAIAARQTASAGYRTLLVDKQPFPRAKVCGACVNDRALRVLSLLGLEGCISELPSVQFDTFELTCGAHQAKIALPGGMAIARRELDDALVREAIRTGASWLPETTANVGHVSDTGLSRAVALTDVVSQHCQSANAKIVLVADGLGSPSLQRREDEFPAVISQASRIGVGGTVGGQVGIRSDKTIHMNVSKHGYVGFVALPDGSLNVAAALDVAFLKSQSDVASGMSTILANSKINSLDLRGTTWKGTPRLTRRLHRPVSTRVLVLGDAAGYVEPFTGEGIAWAITSGAAAALLVPQGISHWTKHLEIQWVKRSHRLIQQHQFLCRVLARTLRSHRLASVATQLFSAFPGLALPIARQSSSLPRHVERFLRAPVRKASPPLPTSEPLVPLRTSTGDFRDEL